MLGGRWRFIRYFSLAPFAPLGRGHQGTMFAIGREHTMEPGKVALVTGSIPVPGGHPGSFQASCRFKF